MLNYHENYDNFHFYDFFYKNNLKLFWAIKFKSKIVFNKVLMSLSHLPFKQSIYQHVYSKYFILYDF